jgi:cystathionine beta-lyase
MWVADMDFASAPEIIQALKKRIEHGVFGYAVATDELREATIEWVYNHYDWKIRPDWLVWLPGLVPALHTTCRAFAKQDEQIITFVPVYPPFLSAPKLSNRRLLVSPLKRVQNRYTFDIENFKNSITNRTRVLILCSPHNPVGRAYTKGELEAVAQICIDNNIIICSDEIHCDLILDDRRHIPTATISSDIRDNTITLMAPSKTFNTPGLNCSFAVIPNKELKRKFIHAAEGIVPPVNALGYIACLAAFKHCEDWRQEMLKYLRENRDIVYDFVNNDIPIISMDRVEATYLAWIDVRKLNLPDPVAFFEENAGVGLSDGKYFDGDEFVRLNFACPRKILTKALQRMKTAVTGRLKT